jgi:hypothetical protein
VAPKGPHSPVLARLASGAFYETIGLVTYYKIRKSISVWPFEKRMS